jgi:WD40 repeat protein
MSSQKKLNKFILCMSIAIIPSQFLFASAEIDYTGLENLEKHLKKVSRYNFVPKGRNPAGKNKSSWVPTGKVHANMMELYYNFVDETKGDELYFPANNPNKWMSRIDYSNDEGVQTFQKLGSSEKEKVTFKTGAGSMSGIIGTEYIIHEEQKEIKTTKGEARMLPYARVYDLKSKKEVFAADCTTLDPNLIPLNSYSLVQVAYVDQKWKASCSSTHFVFDDKSDFYSRYNLYFRPKEKSLYAQFESRPDKYSIVLPFENYQLSVAIKNAELVISEDYGIGKEVKVLGKISTLKIEADNQNFQYKWLNPNLLALIFGQSATGEGEVYFWQVKKKSFLETKLPINTNGSSSYTFSISPDGSKLLLSDSKYLVRLFDVKATKLVPISLQTSNFIAVGKSTEPLKMTEQELKTKYAKANFLSNANDGSWQFISFMDLPEYDYNSEKQVTRRSRIKYYRLNSSLKLEAALIKGSEGAISASKLDFGVSDQLIVYFHNQESRLFNFKTLTMLPKTRMSRFRNYNNIGQDVLTSNGGVVQQSYTPVHWDDISLVSESPKMIEELLQNKASFCSRSIPSNSRWLKIPMPTDQAPEMGEDTLEALKLRFQKPSGISLSTDLKAIMYLFDKEKIADQDPVAASLILANILHHSELLFEYLVKNYVPLRSKDIRQLDPTSKKVSDNICLSESEKSVLQESARQYLLALLSRNVSDYEGEVDFPTKSVKIDQLLHYFGLILKPLLYLTDKTAAEDAADKLAQALADKTKQDKYFSQIFFSKLYKFAYKFAAPFYGLKSSSIIDYTIARLGGEETYDEEAEGEPIAPSKSSLTGLVMGTNPFIVSGKDATGKSKEIKAQRSGYGFFYVNTGTVDLVKGNYKVKTKIDLPELMGAPKIKVEQGSKSENYHGDLAVSYLPDMKIIPEEQSFQVKTAQSAGDKSFTGLMMFGYDLGDEQYIFDEYVSFYKDRGYKFKAAETVTDIKAWATDLIAKDKLDYLLKEAHSDGDEKNLFQFYNKVKMLHGQKGSGSKMEDIYLTFPIKDDQSPLVLWGNDEFGAAVHKRQLPFSYLNTSCWSVAKAPFEIQEARNAKFYNIASTTMVDTFYNQEDSAMYQLIRGLLEGKDFESVRGEKYLGMNKENLSGENNVYIFPGQEEYAAQIESKLSIPVSVDLKLFNSTTKKEVEITDLH